MANIITQAQYNTSQQTIRNTYLKINLLNFDYLTVDSLEGSVVTGSIQINSDSDIRRTCDISLVVTDSSFDVQAGGEIWIDKLIQIYVGVQNLHTSEIEWTNMGIYLINQPSYQYDAVTHTLTFSGVDLMSRMTGLRNMLFLNVIITMGTYKMFHMIWNMKWVLVGMIYFQTFETFCQIIKFTLMLMAYSTTNQFHIQILNQ